MLQILRMGEPRVVFWYLQQEACGLSANHSEAGLIEEAGI